jgi:hypothetical protein
MENPVARVEKPQLDDEEPDPDTGRGRCPSNGPRSTGFFFEKGCLDAQTLVLNYVLWAGVPDPKPNGWIGMTLIGF